MVLSGWLLKWSDIPTEHDSISIETWVEKVGTAFTTVISKSVTQSGNYRICSIIVGGYGYENPQRCTT